ncbi:polysaccharide deacetylase family protein [Tepidicaulis sp.]|uniref:polysaccharide deacetylase family protein n=1 Tax=Tepidicaulis sp. TaxID=1920809 RepID=UPI003B5CBF8D
MNRAITALLAAFGAALLASLPAYAQTPCPGAGAQNVLGPARIIEVDTQGGGAYGTLQYARSLDLGEKEILFTFDDGPDPEVTPQILDTLDRHCLKATFFFTGLRAERYPELVREAWRRGHTIATHTYSHPNNLRRFAPSYARAQITRGQEAIAAALQGAEDTKEAELAPFFRFPGLNDSARLKSWLAAQDIAVFSCDFGSDDWRRISAWSVYKRTMRNASYVGRGIVIMHDTKARTATALPMILDELVKRGFTAAHMRPKKSSETLAGLPEGTLRPEQP